MATPQDLVAEVLGTGRRITPARSRGSPSIHGSLPRRSLSAARCLTPSRYCTPRRENRKKQPFFGAMARSAGRFTLSECNRTRIHADFYRVIFGRYPPHGRLFDLRGDRGSKQAQTDMVFRKAFSVVRMKKRDSFRGN